MKNSVICSSWHYSKNLLVHKLIKEIILELSWNTLQKKTLVPSTFHFWILQKQNDFVRSGIRTHALIRGPECSLVGEESISWVWRLRPLGHPDIVMRGQFDDFIPYYVELHKLNLKNHWSSQLETLLWYDCTQCFFWQQKKLRLLSQKMKEM